MSHKKPLKFSFNEIDMHEAWILEKGELTITPPQKTEDKTVSGQRLMLIFFNDQAIGGLHYQIDENNEIQNVVYREDINFKNRKINSNDKKNI